MNSRLIIIYAGRLMDTPWVLEEEFMDKYQIDYLYVYYVMNVVCVYIQFLEFAIGNSMYVYLVMEYYVFQFDMYTIWLYWSAIDWSIWIGLTKCPWKIRMA